MSLVQRKQAELAGGAEIVRLEAIELANPVNCFQKENFDVRGSLRRLDLYRD